MLGLVISKVPAKLILTSYRNTEQPNYCYVLKVFRIISLCAEVPRPLFLPATRPSFSLAQAAKHLRREQEGLKERACGEAARERAEEAGRGGRVVKPPNVLETREPVDVDVVRSDQLKQAETTVRATESALLDAAPGRLRDAVRVENLVDHNGAGLDA